jgi:Carboxypeptidase regulatory-like domain
MIRRISRVALGCCALASSPAAAQVVELKLLDEASRAPIAGAIVRLLRDNTAIGQGLTNALGRIVFRAPAPGNYRIKADRIGFSGLLTEPIALAGGETVRRELLMPSTPRLLPTIEVRGKSACDPRGEEGTLAAALWEEIRKALTANVITQRQGAVTLHVRKFHRDVSLSGKPIREWVYGSDLVRGQPFVSMPAATLAKAGFVEQLEGDSVGYAAPDAALLLSDEFVATHCFRPVNVTEKIVGLAFEPVKDRRVVDVRGTLWVDRASSELQFLEYIYSIVPEELKKADLGGRVEFHRLPTGAWIVSYWHIRMPTLRASEVRGLGNVPTKVIRLVGLIETGGRAEIASDALGRVDRAMVVGRIYDSIAGGGLAGATVTVQGTPDSIVTDPEGRFRIAVAASGDQVVAVSHPRLGLLGEATTRAVLLSLGDTTAVSFAAPSLATLGRKLCGVRATRTGLVGITFGESGTPVEGLEVRATWLAPSGGTSEGRDKSGPRGLYAICDLPAGPTLTVQLRDRTRPLSGEKLRLEWAEFRWLELRPAKEGGAPPAGPAITVRP